MFNLISADLYKIRKSMSIKILFLITTISAVIMTIMAYEIPKGNIDASMIGMGFMFSDINMMSILGGVMAGIFICGDFDNKIINDAVAGGSSRSTVIISKAVVFSFTIIFLLLPYVIAAGVALGTGSRFGMGSVAVGFLNIISAEAGTAFSAAQILKIIILMLTLIIVYIGQLSICVPLALLLKKPVFVVAIYYGFSILCTQLFKLAQSSSVFNNIFSCTPYGGNYLLLSLNAGAGEILKAIAASLIFAIIMIAITHLAFRKSEIK